MIDATGRRQETPPFDLASLFSETYRMSNTDKRDEILEDEQSFSMKEYLTTCLSKWGWFVISFVFFICVGYLYVLRQPQIYSRSITLLIKDPNSSTTLDMGSAFSQFGLGGGNTNVNNELISITSPAVMYEVVKRLHLNVMMTKKGLLHGTSLYDGNNPVDLEYPDLTESTSVAFLMDLNPDDTYKLYKFKQNLKGEKLKYDNEITGKLGFNPVATPVGTVYLRPNGKYSGEREEPMTIYVNVNSYAAVTEAYVSKVTGDLVDSDAEVISLTIKDSNVARATDVLNTIVEVYNEFWIEDKNKVNVATSKFITDRLNTLSQELENVDNEISDYQQQHKIADLTEAGRVAINRAASVSGNVLEASNQLAVARYVRDYITNPANANNVIPTEVGIPAQALAASIKDYNTLLLTRNNLIRNSGEMNPVVKDYDAQIKGLRESILRSLNSMVGTLETQVKGLEDAENASDTRLENVPEQAKFLGSIKREQTVKESLYLYLLQKREESELTKSYTATNNRVITPPWGPRKPVSPKKSMILIFCAIVGLAVPAGLIYIMVLMNDTVNSKRDLENLPIPFTGEIPLVGKKNTLKKYLKTRNQRQKDIDKPKPIVAEGKRDVPNEAFRVVRSNIDLMIGRGAGEKVIMVTSFNPGSGKSFVAFNLGASFALKNKNVLLIDGDLRHGSLSSYVDSPRKGLSTYLQGNTDDIDSLIRKVEGYRNLSLLPIGHRPPNPAELLETNRFGEMLEKLKGEYDIILVDCPPVNVVVDTQLINKYADRTIFVVRAGLLKRSAVPDLVNLYDEKKLKRMSLLLNGTEQAHSSYYTYGNYQSLEE